MHRPLLSAIIIFLGLVPADVTAAATPIRLEYKAVSRSAAELTAYAMELFDTKLSADAAAAIAANPKNRWLGEAEIARLEANDARPVSPTMHLLLSMAGRI